MPETKLKVQQQQQQQEHHHQQQQHYHTHPPASSTSKNNALSFFDKPPRTANIKYSRPMETLSTYSKATQILDKLYDRFQTEYSREFVDWNHEFDAKRRKLARSKIDSATETAAGGALVAAAVPTQTEASRSIVSLKDHFAVEVATKELPPSLQDNLQDHQSITQNTATTTTTAVSAPSPPRLSSRLTKTIASADPDYHEKDDKAVGAEDGFASVESKATSTTTAPHTSFPIVIAGMPSNGTFNYREKKHFPYKKDHLQVQVEQLERELQASAGQAQSLLERASKRRH